MTRCFPTLTASSVCSLLSALVLLGGSPKAHAVPISLFNTGVSTSALPLPGGAQDPHWSVVSGPGITTPAPAVVVSNQNPSGLYAQDQSSRWIWVNASGSGATNSPYTFQFTLDLTGFDPGSTVIAGRWGVDDNGRIRLNGADAIGTGALIIQNSTPFQVLRDFTITGGFVGGLNTLSFLATDTGNPGAINVAGLSGSASPIPETTPVYMLSIGLLLLVWRRHACRSGAANA